MQSSVAQTFVVWMHRDGVSAVGHFEDRGVADGYAGYLNRRHPVTWFEVRPHDEAA